MISVTVSYGDELFAKRIAGENVPQISEVFGELSFVESISVGIGGYVAEVEANVKDIEAVRKAVGSGFVVEKSALAHPF